MIEKSPPNPDTLELWPYFGDIPLSCPMSPGQPPTGLGDSNTNWTWFNASIKVHSDQL